MSAASTVTTVNPWGTASPYITDILGRAQSLYGQQAPLYANPSANFGYGPATGAVGNALGGNTTLGGMANELSPIASGNIVSQFANPFGTTGNLDATSAIRQQLSGTPDYSAVQGALDAANTQQWNQFYNQVVPQLNQRASFLGNPSGAIKDLNSAITNIGQNQSLNAQQAYLGQYNLAQQRQQAASSLVANGGLQGQANAVGLGGLAGNLAQGQGSQALSAAQLYPGISGLPQQNLLDYSNIVRNTAGQYGTNTQNITPGSGQTLANVLGGLAGGAGLLNNLFGTSKDAQGNAVTGIGSQLFNKIGNYFNGGSSPSNYSSLNNFLNNGNSTAIIDQYGSNGIMANTPDYSGFTSPDLQQVNVDPSLWDTTGNINWGDGSGGFSSAGGQAAEPTASDFQGTNNFSVDAYQATAPDSTALNNTAASSMGSLTGAGALGAAGGALGVVNGLRSGTAVGDASAALGAAKIGAKFGAFGADSKAVGNFAGGAANVLGIYSGLQQGGVAGDSSAAVNAAMLGSKAGAFGAASGTIGNVAGAAAIPLALYSEINSYESGATGSDALSGASTGAAIGGYAYGPIGALAGGVIGGAVGAITSAFGPGAKDPETAGVQKLLNVVGSHPDQAGQITQAVQNPYIAMAGLFDRRESQLPMYQQYGRMGEQKFTTDMVGKINQAVANGTISKNSSADEIYSKVVDPWVSSMGTGWKNVGKTYTDTTQGLLKQMITQYTSGQYANNWRSISDDNPFGNTPSFGGGAPAPFVSLKPPKATTQQRQNAAQRGAGGRIAA